ncbi:uncharacterized protein [Parasteatoda tepidariorum]|uniref:uncharacterized protein isoform X2 n=1 Tax=Parasteatoda tepidariorum TaxID=114398 RepID=UPI00077FA24F|nr:uncharacterized protein LOC107448236 isoform X2 [Parasteatoda tepidariorum]
MRNLAAENMSSKAAPLSSEFLITLNDPRVLWNENWLAVVLELAGAILIYQVCKNAKMRQSESRFLVLAAMIATMCFEILPFFRAGYELWWYHPGFLNIIRARLPSYIISSFALTQYVADCLTKDAKLPTLTRAFVTSIFSLLIIAPFVWMAPRLLLITYHFDDPVFKDRIFDIPAIQLLVLLLLSFHTSHLFYENCDELSPHQKNTSNYILCALQSGLVAAIYTTVEQYVLYMLFKLTMQLHTGTCLLVAGAMLAYLAKGEIEYFQLKTTSKSGFFQPLKNKAFWGLAAAFIFLITLPLWMNSEDIKSTGTRLELGPCGITHAISNTNPLDVTRRRFVCPEDTRLLNYDFHCVAQNEMSQAVKDIRKTYTICGKSFVNYLQTVQIMAVYSVLCLLVFHSVMRFSFAFQVEKKTIPKIIE